MFGLSLTSLRLIGGAIIIVAYTSGVAAVTHHWDQVKLQSVELSYQTAQAKAIAKAQAMQKRFDDIALAQAQQENTTQSSASAQADTQLHEVEFHVSTKVVASNCVPLGLIRVLDAAASGRPTSNLSLPTGKSDDSCAPSTWPAVGRSIVANYYTARANSEQLNRLVDTLRQMQRTNK